jgi:uncharacterized protein YbjT (DUF2867 family)
VCEDRILVVATGRVGAAAVRRLLEAVFETRTLARSAGKGAPLLALGTEVAVGDVARPETLAPALEGCAGVFSAFSASTDRQAGEVEYRGNVNLLSAGGRRAALRLQLARARGLPAGEEGRGLQGEGALPGGAARRWRRLRERFASALFMETLLMALSEPVAFVQVVSGVLSAGSPRATWPSPPSGHSSGT